MDRLQAFVNRIKTPRGIIDLDLGEEIDVSDLVHVNADFHMVTEKVTIAALLERRPDLDLIPGEDADCELAYRIMGQRTNRSREELAEADAQYHPDPDGTGRFGWRQPGMHVRPTTHPGAVCAHGPGKRKKGKRK